MNPFGYLISFIFICPLLAQVQLTAPDSAPAGSLIEVSWSQVVDSKDFVTVVLKATPEGKYDVYKTASAKLWKMPVPEVAGTYEIRYLKSQRPYETLARKVLEVTAVTATLQVNGEVDAGADFQIQWTGPNNPQDFITVVKPDAAQRAYGKYFYTKKGSPQNFKAPEEPGDYEIRYLTGRAYNILARAPLRVKGVSASLDVPAQVEAGATIEIQWQGPDHSHDYITIVKAGAPKGTYNQYAYTKSGNPVRLKAPEVAGKYEIRYLTGGANLTLASAPVTVGASKATVKVSETVKAGALVSVSWSGPNNPGDFITIVPKGTPEREYGKYRYTQSGSPLSLTAPDVPGQYEVRYLTSSKWFTLASAALKVEPVTAELKAPESVKSGESLAVQWTGPDNPYDFIALAPAGSDHQDFATYRYTHHGNPAQISINLEPGDYEIRYQTGQNYFVLANRPVVVSPPDLQPGKLLVAADEVKTGLAGGSAVELILDASGSMLKRLDGKRRIDIAKAVLLELIREKLPPGTPFALRVFGHREADSCRTDLEMALAPLQTAKAVGLIQKIQAKNLAKTPIGKSLEMVASDLAPVTGERIVILITDGEETCGGDPAESIQKLKDAGMDLRVNIVGFAIDDQGLKQKFRLWAELGEGRYFDTKSATDLGSAVTSALKLPFDVYNGAGLIVASGLVGGEPVSLPAGQYRIQTREANPRVIQDAEVPSGETKTVVIPGR